MSYSFRTIDKIDVNGSVALVRADLNVPIIDGKISDSSRIEAVAPTLLELSKNSAKVVILSHFGRPKGKERPSMSLKPLLPHLNKVLGGREVAFASNCIGDEARRVIDNLGAGDVALLENTRFHPGEEANDKYFSQELGRLGNLFINDAFSASHRAHASTTGIARFLPTAAGRLMEKELSALESALLKPAHPVVAIVGGAKVSTKIEVLSNLIKFVDVLVIGGGMANTFLNANGIDIGKSLCEKQLSSVALKITEKSKASGCELILPVDGMVACKFVKDAPNARYPINNIPQTGMILDVGPDTVEKINEAINSAQTLIWNGPIGAFEIPPFDDATISTAKTAALQTRKGKLLSVAGGGDTVAALKHSDVLNDFSYVSMAGGAFLEWLEGKILPGIEALKN